MDIATLGLAVDSRPVADASAELDRISAAAAKAERAAGSFGTRTEAAGRRAAAANDNVARSAEKVRDAYGRWEQVAAKAARAVGLVAGALATNALFAYADQWSDMQSRVGAAIKNMDAAPAMMQRIVDIANASYSPLDQTVEIYGRNVAVLRDLGRTATEAADFTEALNHALVTTATKGQDADVVLNALSRSIAIGGLRSMEFETIMSRSPRVLEAIANELGTNVTNLRSFAQQGKVTGDVIVNALINNLEKLREEAGEMPATISDAFTRLRTNFTAFVGQMDQATGASQRISAAVMVVADNINEIAKVAALAGGALLLAMGPAILGQIAFAFGYMGAAAVHAMNLIRLAVLTNPIGALVVAITTAVTAVYLFRDAIKQAIGIDLVAIIEGGINTVVGVFVGGYEAVTTEWRNLPAVMGDLASRAGQALVDGIVTGLNTALNKIREWYTLINPIAGIMKLGGFDLGEMMGESNIAAPTIPNPWAEQAGASRANMAAIFDDALSRDYVGALKEMAFGSRTAAEAAAGLDAAIASAGKGAGKASKEAQKLAKAYAKIVLGAKEFIATQELERQALGMTEQEANRLRYTQDLLNDAKRAGIKLSVDQTAELERLGKQMADTEAQTSALKRAFDFAKDLTRGFMNDLRSGLEQGKSFWESFGNAAVNALDKIVDKLLNDVIDALFQVNNAGSNMGGGGILGFLGGLLGIGGGLSLPATAPIPTPRPFSAGGYTGPGAASQPAGIVHAGEYVFSKAAVDRIGLGYLEGLHSSAKGYMNGGYVRTHAPANLNMRGYQAGGQVQSAPNASAQPVYQDNRVIKVDARGAQSGVGEEIRRALIEYDREVLPARVNAIANDPYARG